MVEYGTWVAILVFAYEATGPASVGAIAVIQLVPAVVFAPLAASLGDRYRRDRVLLAGYLLLGLASLATGLAIVAGAPPAVVYACAIVAASAVTMPRPIQGAILPAYADTAEELTSANAINAIFEGWGVLFGPLAAGLLMAVWSPGSVYVAAALLCLVSAGLVATVRARSAHPATEAPAPTDGSRTPDAPTRAAPPPEPAAATPGLLDGARAVLGDANRLLVVLILAGRFAAIGALDVLLVLHATESLGIGGSGAGYLNAALGLGGVLGGATTLVLVGRGRLSGWLAVGAAVWGTAFAIVAGVQVTAVALVLLVIGGIGLAVVDVAGRTLLQRISPGEVLAGVFGLVEGFAMAGLAVGSVFATVAYGALGLAGATLLTAAFLPVVVLASASRLVGVEAGVRIPVREIEILRRLALFAPVPAPALEVVARNLVRLTMPAGTVVIREGDIGDRFYVLATGTVAVSQGDRLIRTLGPGDPFGQIALLRDIPRTATVTAVGDLELWALDRESFLYAMTGSPNAAAQANAMADTLLAGDGDARRRPGVRPPA